MTFTWPDGQTITIDLPGEVTIDVQRDAVLASLTAAESRVLNELAHRPDTRSRLAARLGVTTSTLDNQLASIKRKVLSTWENAPEDGYLSMEALIGWAHHNYGEQES
ncbi:MAG: hypothetical protein QOF21_1569 [Actinomycetota bacterium]